MAMETTSDGKSTRAVALIAYAARYHPRIINYRGMTQPVPVLLKEVLPGARCLRPLGLGFKPKYIPT